MRLPGLVHASLAAACLGALTLCAPAATSSDDTGDVFRVSLFPSYRITDDLTGFGYLGYIGYPDDDSATWYGGPGLIYSPARWLQLWTGVTGRYTDDQIDPDRFELRPFVGIKLVKTTRRKWHLYNFTRFEGRFIEDLDTHDWSDRYRLRNRLGLEIPLASPENAWQPGAWYLLADVEPTYRFDTGKVDPLRFRAGLARIVNERIRVELQYYVELTPSHSGSLTHADNIFRLNVKIARDTGILQKLFDSGSDD